MRQETQNQIDRIALAARHEQLMPGETIGNQKGAIRLQEEYLNIKVIGWPDKPLYPGFAQIYQMSDNNKIFWVITPLSLLWGLVTLPAGQLLVVNEIPCIQAGQYGRAFNKGIQPVPLYTGENEAIEVGDCVGPLTWDISDSSEYQKIASHAIRGGPFVVVKTNCNSDTWIVNEQYIAGGIAGLESKIYRCLANHLSNSNNRPGTGSLWTDYWQQIIYINMDVSY